jgi:MFS transporter, ACS family, D-galactonate transporter
VATTTAPSPRPGALRRLWNRELPHYPTGAKRIFNLGLVVVLTIMMYYQYFLTAAVSGHILHEFKISFMFWIGMAVLGNVLGALASLGAGLGDKYGRANMVVASVIIIAALGVFAVPNAHSGAQFMTINILVGIVEGVALVAAPALIRDFSPQVGRGAAMGFWAIGPVAASLLVSLVVSNFSDSTPWQHHYILCGIVGLALGVVALFSLRELSPALRDQLMVSVRDRALLEARAKGIDVEASLRHPFRQVLKFDIVGSALGIGFFMIVNFTLIAFLPIMFQTAFGFTQAAANSLGNWTWAANGITLLVVGFASDKLRVRKPFMLAGAIGGVLLTTTWALHLTQPQTSYTTFAFILAGVAICIGLVFGTWMAAFTETVEKRNPALTATGLSVWGMVFRFIGALTLFAGPHVVGAVTTIAQHGPTVKALATGTAPTLTAAQNATVKAIVGDPTIVVKLKAAAVKNAPELATAAKIDPATQAALKANPADPAARVKAVADVAGLPVTTVGRVLTLGKLDVSQLSAADQAFLVANGKQVKAAAGQLVALAKVPAADLKLLGTYGKALQDKKVQASLLYLKDHGPAVKKAVAAAPHEWQNFLWIAVGGQLLFIPLIFVMAGAWDPRKARRKAQEHEAWLQAQLTEATATERELQLV